MNRPLSALVIGLMIIAATVTESSFMRFIYICYIFVHLGIIAMLSTGRKENGRSTYNTVQTYERRRSV